MLMYSWKLAVPVVILVIPLLLVVGKLQAGFSVAYTDVRTRVGEMLSEVSESVMGAAVVRAYGLDETVDRRVKRRDRRPLPGADGRAPAGLDVVPDLRHVLARWRWPSVVVVGAIYGSLGASRSAATTAFLFLAQLFLDPFSDLPEIYSETQTAIAGWRKILSVLDLPVEIQEPAAGVELPRGALEVEADDVRYAYPGSDRVLHGITMRVPAGRQRGHRGRDRMRQDDVREAADSARRPRGRHDPARRRRPARGGAVVAPRGRAHGAAGRVPVRRDRAGERAVRARGRERPRRGHGLRGARPRRVDRVPARGPRHDGRRARRGGERRRAAARGAGARADRVAGTADPRRGDERGGPGHRTAASPRRSAG